MRDKRIVFAIEGLSVRILRQIHGELGQLFTAVKTIERVTDMPFSNFANADLAVFCFPRSRERAEMFIRSVGLRSKSIPIYIFCSPKEAQALEGLKNTEFIKKHFVDSNEDFQAVIRQLVYVEEPFRQYEPELV